MVALLVWVALAQSINDIDIDISGYQWLRCHRAPLTHRLPTQLVHVVRSIDPIGQSTLVCFRSRL